jgi:hypothetical protein
MLERNEQKKNKNVYVCVVLIVCSLVSAVCLQAKHIYIYINAYIHIRTKTTWIEFASVCHVYGFGFISFSLFFSFFFSKNKFPYYNWKFKKHTHANSHIYEWERDNEFVLSRHSHCKYLYNFNNIYSFVSTCNMKKKKATERKIMMELSPLDHKYHIIC